MMAPKEICCVLFICLFGLGSAEYCTESSDCVVEGETCCSDNVCRAICSYCSYNFECGSGEQCCNNECKYSCGLSAEAITGVIIGTTCAFFFAIIIAIVSCFYCARCPCYRRYRTPGVLVVSRQPYQPFVSTHTHTTITQQVQAPPPVNYNQPPLGFNQAPPPYSTYLPPLNQNPPPPGQTQAGPMPAAVTEQTNRF